MKNRRRLGGDIRATEGDDGQKLVTLKAITVGTVDDYGSMWEPAVFDESLGERLPTLAWGHNWSDPIGRGISFEKTSDGPNITFRLDYSDDVPQAKRAYAQVKSGTIDDCSVGFSNVQRRDPTDAERKKYPGVREIIEKADLDEVSLVLRGAVPGAKVLAVRAKGGATVEQSFVIELARQVAAGELTQEEATIAIDLASDADPGGEGPPDDGGGEVGAAEIDAEMDAALEAVGDRSRR